jgi:hypothetical protein
MYKSVYPFAINGTDYLKLRSLLESLADFRDVEVYLSSTSIESLESHQSNNSLLKIFIYHVSLFYTLTHNQNNDT